MYLEGQTKDIEVVSQLTSLTLRSITLPNLALLQPLAQLRALDINGQLEYVELWMIRGFSDLAPAVDNAIAVSFVEDVGW